MKYLIDTHIFIWWACNPEKLPDNIISIISNKKNTVYLSAASSWEVQIKINLGKITFTDEWENIVMREIEKNSFTVLPVQLSHTFALKKLPHLHRDPFDRILIAQALAEDLTVLTGDSLISSYPGVKICC